jgi:hypothetical protein
MSTTPEPNPDAGAGSGPTIAAHKPDADFFERNAAERPEIIASVIREGQIGIIAGTYGVGKTPLLADIIEHVLNGRTWLGHAVHARPVISIDFETSSPVYKRNIRNIARRLGVPKPQVPDELDVYLEQDDPKEPGTAELLAALGGNIQARLNLLERALSQKPKALVIIDPPETLFRLDTAKRTTIQALYIALRRLLSKFPEAAMLLVFNLRKKDRKDRNPPDLLTDPRAWLEEICGSVAILDRCDVRLGMDFYGSDGVKVINGVRRGEDIDPLFVRSVGGPPDNWAGFELVVPTEIDLQLAFTPKQKEYWDKLPVAFNFDEVADKLVPRASLFRLLKRAESLGVSRLDHGRYRKVAAKE